MKAKIDSLNLSLENHTVKEILDGNKDKLLLETVKDIGIFNPLRWSETFGKSLTKNIKRAYILYSFIGVAIPIKSYSRSQNREVIEFAGLQGYNERGELLKELFRDIYPLLEAHQIQRCDICIDFEKIPNGLLKNLSENRIPYKFKNTIYFKTQSEKKINNYFDVKMYEKSKKEKLPSILHRLEFCFKGDYLKKTKLKDIATLFAKMEKTIKEVSGLKIRIEPL